MDKNYRELAPHQKEAIDAVKAAVSHNHRRILLILAAGSGKSQIAVDLFDKALTNHHCVLYLTSHRALADQYASLLHKKYPKLDISHGIEGFSNQRVCVATMHSVYANRDKISIQLFDAVIVDDISFVAGSAYMNMLDSYKGIVIAFTSDASACKKNSLISSMYTAYQYSAHQAINDGHIVQLSETYLIETFCQAFFRHLGYDDIIREPDLRNHAIRLRPDFLLPSRDNLIICEIKYYEKKHPTPSNIHASLERITTYQAAFSASADLKIDCLLMVFGVVSKQQRNEINHLPNVVLWDIANILYLCKNNRHLYNSLLGILPFTVSDIYPVPPESMLPDSVKAIPEIAGKPTMCSETFIEQLHNCPSGKDNGASGDYELLGDKIMRYLFATEFTKIINQHKTDDDLFRMDMICGLKGSEEFWKFLIRYYNTKFVVFEFKNYSDYISQNLIYVTEKYLFDVALRNVAIIVSRKGFHSNAQKAAIGCLKEHGKLIIDIADEDLINMLRLKDRGSEPSDYLLSKVEDFLMSVGK